MLESMRPAWTYQNRTENNDQEIGLLEDREKDNQEDATVIDYSPTKPLFSRIRQHISFDREQLQDLKPAWLKPRKERKIHPTSYLDGLRGVASFLVFIHHSSLALYPEVRPGYGVPQSHNYIIQLPVLRVVYSGAAMVDIFFVISGFVLSTKSLRLAREGQHQKLWEGLASSTFRRGPRLFIPCIISTFVTAIIAYTPIMLTSGITRNYPHSPIGLGHQLQVWITEMLQFCQPFAAGTIWEPNLWTIPIEYRGSLLIFLSALGLSKVRSTAMRTGMLVMLTAYWLYMGAWELLLFSGGMLVAECSLYRKNTVNHSIVIKILHGLMLLFCIYLLSMPEEGEGVAQSWYGFAFFDQTLTPASWHHHAPPGRWWVCLSAVSLVGILEHSGPTSLFQRAFTTRFAQYLGEVSFSFYLWHGLAIFTVGARVMTYMISIAGAQGLGWWISLITTYSAVLFVLFWISDVSTIFVDRGAVNFAKKLMNL